MNGARYAYLARICALVEQSQDIILVSNDYAAPILDGFRVDYPKRYVSVGIGEQNLIAVSCGLALAGKRVIAYGAAPFPVTRAFDQIKCAASMMCLPINLVVAGAGFSTPEYGATHYNIEDISLIRTIPNMRVITPIDTIMGVAAADYALVNTTPVYLRFDKYCEGELYAGHEIDFQRGFEILHEGLDLVVITTGYLTHRILKLVEQWNKDGLCPKIIDLYSLPVDTEALLAVIGNIPVLTVEEHVLPGGIGSMVLEILHEHGLTNPLQRLGINFSGGYPLTSGRREYYIAKYGLSDHHITSAAFSLFNSKSRTENRLVI